MRTHLKEGLPLLELELPEQTQELLCAFDHPNCYGISPEDLWLYYRKGIQFPGQKIEKLFPVKMLL